MLIANIFAAKRIWENAAKTRYIMKAWGTRKEQSCSKIEMKGKITAFLTSDRSHPLITKHARHSIHFMEETE